MENITQGQWFRGPSADLGETIEQSLRFRGGQCLHHTFSRASTGNTATLSFWVKMGKIDMEHCFIINRNGSHRFVNVRAGNDWCFNAAGSSFTSYDSNTLVRDISAWYHVLVIQNSGTTSLYVNGSQVGSSTTGVSGFWNSTGSSQIVIGAENDSPGGSTSQCYLAEYNLLDGTAIGVTNGVPDEFGRYNEDGIWVPKDISGLTSDQYGADGFRLVFDSSAGLGDDSAPTGGNHASANDFTAVGFDTTAISSSNTDNDIDFEDTPTSNHAVGNRLHPHQPSKWGNCHLTVDNPQDDYFRSNFQLPSSGKFYWEINNDGDGSSNAQSVVYGITNPGGPDTNNLTSSAFWRSASGFDGTAAVAVDMDAGEIWFAENNTWASGDPSAGTSPSHSDLLTAYDPVEWFCLFGGYRAVNYSINFGQMPFQYTPPTGFNALQTNNLPEPTIKNGKEHFDVVTYSGNGTSQSITGLEFQPDLVWIKKRNSPVQSHILQDVVRGTGETLRSNTSDGDIASSNYLTAFNSDGFSVAGDSGVNDGSGTYVAWCWKAGGTAVSNTDGTITSSVSANTDAGFSIVSYTGNNTNGATVGHGLTSAPEWMLVKTRGVSGNWAVYHTGAGAVHALQLDSNAAASDDNTFWNDTAPGNSVFTLGTHGRVNGNGNTQIAYCWHSVEGFSKFGSYTGNGNADGPFVYTGFTPHFLLVKCWSTGGSGTYSWQLIDTTRQPTNFNGKPLHPDTNEIEQNFTSAIVDILSNGFKITGSASQYNQNGQDYVYMAFASNPFAGENQPPATAR